MIFHAFDGNVTASFDTLSFQDFTEGSFTLFTDQFVLYHKSYKKQLLLFIFWKARLFFFNHFS